MPRNVSKLNKKQEAHSLAMQILGLCSSLANDVKTVLTKGIDGRGQPIKTTPDLVKKSFDQRQLEAVERFIDDFGTEPPEPPPKPTDEPRAKRNPRK